MAEQEKEMEPLNQDASQEAAEEREEAAPGGEGAEKEGPDREGSEKEGTEKEGSEQEDPEDGLSEEDDEKDGSAEGNAGDEDPMTRAQKRAAKKQAKHDKKTDALKEQIEHLEDRVKRQLAEFENFRNRSEKEKHAMFETGAKSVIEKMLPVVDNFERGLATVPEENRQDPFVDGMNRIYKQLLTELENIGVKPIEAVGQEFDPNLHNAVMQVASEEYESGVIAQELQKGYTYHDLVVRHSMVAVTE